MNQENKTNTNMNQENKIKLLVDDPLGIYIPQAFCENFYTKEWGISGDDSEILKGGPGEELYWETWDDVLNNAEFKDEDGYTWRLWQDGPLFAIREDYEFED